MRPTCSTAYRRFGSDGVDEMPVSAPRPLAYGCSDSWCCCGTRSAAAARNVATISPKVPSETFCGSSLYGLLKKDRTTEAPRAVTIFGLRQLNKHAHGRRQKRWA